MSAPIFISYSSKDHKIAERVRDGLEAEGFACWFSSRDVRPGQNYQEEISRAIRAAKVMLLVFTANANTSDEIKKEVALGGRAKAVVIPFRVENIAPNDAFDYEFATRQWIDAFDGWDEAFRTLTAQIATVVSPSHAVSAPAQPEAPNVSARTPSFATGALNALRKQNALTLLLSAMLLLVAGYAAWHFLGQRLTGAPAKGETAPQSTGDAFPHFRAGLWEQRAAMSSGQTFVSKLCIDPSTESALIAAGASRKDCSQVRTQTIGTATISDTTCKIGATTVTSHSVGRFSSDSAYHLETVSRTDTGQSTTLTVEGRWAGACPATMKPGDMMMPDGKIVNLTRP